MGWVTALGTSGALAWSTLRLSVSLMLVTLDKDLLRMLFIIWTPASETSYAFARGISDDCVAAGTLTRVNG